LKSFSLTHSTNTLVKKSRAIPVCYKEIILSLIACKHHKFSTQTQIHLTLSLFPTFCPFHWVSDIQCGEILLYITNPMPCKIWPIRELDSYWIFIHILSCLSIVTHAMQNMANQGTGQLLDIYPYSKLSFHCNLHRCNNNTFFL
jgi:hypothetical protein